LPVHPSIFMRNLDRLERGLARRNHHRESGASSGSRRNRWASLADESSRYAKLILDHTVSVSVVCIADTLSVLIIPIFSQSFGFNSTLPIVVVIGAVWVLEVLPCLVRNPRGYARTGIFLNHAISFFGLLAVDGHIPISVAFLVPLTLVKTIKACSIGSIFFGSFEASVRVLFHRLYISLYWQLALVISITIVGISLGAQYLPGGSFNFVFLPVFMFVISSGAFILLSFAIHTKILLPMSRFLLNLDTIVGTLSSTVRSINGPSPRLSTGSIDASILEGAHEYQPFELEERKLNRIAERLRAYLAIHTVKPEAHSDLDIAVIKSVGVIVHHVDHSHSLVTKRSVLPPMVDVTQSSLISVINSWEFNPLHMTVDEQDLSIDIIFFHLNHVPLDREAFGNFAGIVREKYRSENPYHRFEHALDVCQTVHRYLQLSVATSFMRSVDRMGLLLAALIHDIGHLGVNNQFLVETGHELAQRYNDQSPLENYHCFEFFRISNELKLFANLSSHDVRDLRRIIIESVLSTDNASHFAMVKELAVFNEVHAEGLHSDSSSILKAPEARKLLNKLFLHSADISNPTKPFGICREWARLVMEEFFMQGDMELAAGIPISPLNDRSKVNIPLSQIGFMEFVVAPLYLEQFKLFPVFQDNCQFLVGNMIQWAAESGDPKLLERCRKVADTFNALPYMGGLYVPSSLS
jgi:hypothetical protein